MVISQHLFIYLFFQGEPGQKGQRGLIGLPGEKVYMNTIIAQFAFSVSFFFSFMYRDIRNSVMEHCVTFKFCHETFANKAHVRVDNITFSQRKILK